MIENFKHDPKLGAVTGIVVIRNKSSILGKIQTIEYASLIGCIKRSQTLAGAVNTISGVFTLFKKVQLLMLATGIPRSLPKILQFLEIAFTWISY